MIKYTKTLTKVNEADAWNIGFPAIAGLYTQGEYTDTGLLLSIVITHDGLMQTTTELWSSREALATYQADETIKSLFVDENNQYHIDKNITQVDFIEDIDEADPYVVMYNGQYLYVKDGIEYYIPSRYK